MSSPLADIPRQYWHDRQWLGLPHEVREPNYFHLLGITSEVADARRVKASGLDLEKRLRELVAKVDQAVESQMANKLLGVLAAAHRVLANEDTNLPREKYLQSVQDSLKAGGRGDSGTRFQKRGPAQAAKVSPRCQFIRHSQPRDGVEKLPAIAAEDGLDEEAQSPVRATGNLGPVTALGTLKPI